MFILYHTKANVYFSPEYPRHTFFYRYQLIYLDYESRDQHLRQTDLPKVFGKFSFQHIKPNYIKNLFFF